MPFRYPVIIIACRLYYKSDSNHFFNLFLLFAIAPILYHFLRKISMVRMGPLLFLLKLFCHHFKRILSKNIIEQHLLFSYYSNNRNAKISDSGLYRHRLNCKNHTAITIEKFLLQRNRKIAKNEIVQRYAHPLDQTKP